MNHHFTWAKLTVSPHLECITGKKRSTLAQFVQYPLQFITDSSMPRDPSILNTVVYLPVKSPADYSPPHLKALVTHIRASLAGEIDPSRAFTWLTTASAISSPAPPPELPPHDKVVGAKVKPRQRNQASAPNRASTPVRNQSDGGEDRSTNPSTSTSSNKGIDQKEPTTPPQVVIRYLDTPVSPDPCVSSFFIRLVTDHES